MNKRRAERPALRGRAEERVGGTRPPPARDADRLVHELQVHQVELELQNEELRSARLETEEALARYTELFEFAPIGYLVLSADGRVRQANLAAARLLGRERARLPGQRLDLFVAPGDLGRFRRFLVQVLAPPDGENGGVDCELGLRQHDGAEVVVHVTAGTLAGREPALVLALQDVTARRRAEEGLREADQRKDAFLAALSHELRNPLGPIRNGLYLLARVAPGSAQAGRAIAVIERQVTHLCHLVEDLLDVTRISRGKVRLARERVELGALVARTVEDHRAGFERLGITLACAPPAEPTWVDGDPTRLAQVLGNLLGNAEKFTSAGGRVDVRVWCDEGGAVLSVRDDGAGVAPEVRAHLFEPFSQAPQTLDRSRGGLGLGLAMVKGLVELHGGSVELASEGPGRGSEFLLRLPVAGAPVAPPSPGLPPSAAGRRVLVIDDNLDAAESLKEILELSGNEVQVAGDGPAGIALARALEPDAVICDIGLPGMDGYEVARALRLLAGPRPLLVALSGYAQPEDVRRAMEAGFDRHVAKPPTIDQLHALLGAAPAPSRPAEAPDQSAEAH